MSGLIQHISTCQEYADGLVIVIYTTMEQISVAREPGQASVQLLQYPWINTHHIANLLSTQTQTYHRRGHMEYYLMLLVSEFITSLSRSYLIDGYNKPSSKMFGKYTAVSNLSTGVGWWNNNLSDNKFYLIWSACIHANNYHPWYCEICNLIRHIYYQYLSIVFYL